jgi:predicted phage-related endonuclease
MSTIELDAKVNSLRALRNLESEIKSEVTAIEDEIKAEMLARNTDTLTGQNCIVTWKTVVSNRFDSAAFKLTHADLFAQYSRTTTSRRFVIA